MNLHISFEVTCHLDQTPDMRMRSAYSKICEITYLRTQKSIWADANEHMQWHLTKDSQCAAISESQTVL